MKVDLKTILILIGIAIIIYLVKCTGNVPVNNTTTNTIIVKDTIIDTVIQHNLQPTYVTNDNSITNLPTDTNFIKKLLNDYFARKEFVDTVRNDSSMMVIINDTVTKNQIVFRSVFTKNNRPTSITTTTVNNYIADKGVFIEGGFSTTGVNAVNDASLSLGLGYKLKQNSIGFTLGTNKSINLHYTYGFYKYK